MKYEFIRNHAEEFDLNDLCEALVVHRSGYTRWRDGNVSERKLADEIIKEAILRIHDEAKGRYGHRPIHAHLKEEEVNCGRDRTLRLMNELGVVSSQKKRFKPLGTDSNHSFGYSPNLLRELGKPEKCDQVWVADTTYLDCENGWMYLATVMDLYSRRIIGWSISDRNNTALICEALRAAVLSRGAIQPGIIHHSDRGSTYASHEYRSLMASEFMDSSMSAKGNCYDNAAMESFYGRFKVSSVGNEKLERRRMCPEKEALIIRRLELQCQRIQVEIDNKLATLMPREEAVRCFKIHSEAVKRCLRNAAREIPPKIVSQPVGRMEKIISEHNFGVLRELREIDFEDESEALAAEQFRNQGR